MKNFSVIKLVSLLLVFSLISCQGKDSLSKNNSQDNGKTTETSTETTTTPTPEEVQGQVIKSDSGKVQVTVPDDWKTQTDLNANADLQVANPSEENYLIILSDAKKDLDNLSLEEHAKLTRGFIEKGIKVISISDGKTMEINNKPAIQYEIKGTIDGINIVYLHTTIETDDYFHQIIAWTLPSKFVTNEPILQKAISSFQEN